MVQARHRKTPAKKTAKRGGSPSAPAEVVNVWMRHQRDLWIVALLVVGLLVALGEAGALGPVGRGISMVLSDFLGVGRYAFSATLLALGVALVGGKIEFERARVGWGTMLGLLSISGVADLTQGRPGLYASTSVLARAGGWCGVVVGGVLFRGLGMAGALVVLFAVFVVATMVITGRGLRALLGAVRALVRSVSGFVVRWWTNWPTREQTGENAVSEDRDPVSWHGEPDLDTELDFADDAPDFDDGAREYRLPATNDFEETPPLTDEFFEADENEGRSLTGPRADDHRERILFASHWELPPLNLLSRTKDQKQDRSLTEVAGEELVDALAAHGVDTTLVGYTVGPTVTRFELELGAGVKVSRVTSLNKDIAYAMASPDVRILAPIPGRSAIGVEVPNRQRSLVVLGDLLASEESLAAPHPLDVPIGRDIAGKTVVVNLGEMPHVLISGATGAGKSSAINSLITALVMRATPDQVRLLLIDPKRVEMGQYNDLPHLLSPVVVDPKKAAGTLAWAVKEMERRYDLLAESGARDITSYQQMIANGELSRVVRDQERVAEIFERVAGLASDVDPSPSLEELPYVVIVVDELNDLMMVAARDVEESVVRIAQMARAVGIHLVLATQRPSVDVITGVIKANVPSRMAFAVSSLADSRVILDQAGAERLIGKGDMLLVTASSNIARRLQSPWVSEEEVRRVVQAWRAQGGRVETVVALDVPQDRGTSNGGLGDDDDDELLRRAREIIVRTQSGSTSMLQRKLRVGFARAGRLMDQLEEEKIVAPGDGSKARRVLVTLEEYERMTSL